jgi:hypothetical protein
VDHIGAGERLFLVTGRAVDRPDKYSIQIGDRAHLTPDGAPWSLVNHSCVPNTAIDFARWDLYALRAIHPGEELGWNYLTTEWELSCPFECGCGADGCDLQIAGFKYLASDRRSQLRPLLSPYIASRLLDTRPGVPQVDHGSGAGYARPA